MTDQKTDPTGAPSDSRLSRPWIASQPKSSRLKGPRVLGRAVCYPESPLYRIYGDEERSVGSRWPTFGSRVPTDFRGGMSEPPILDDIRVERTRSRDDRIPYENFPTGCLNVGALGPDQVIPTRELVERCETRIPISTLIRIKHKSYLTGSSSTLPPPTTGTHFPFTRCPTRRPDGLEEPLGSKGRQPTDGVGSRDFIRSLDASSLIATTHFPVHRTVPG